MHCISFITRVFLDEIGLFRNGEHNWHIGHRLKVLLYRVLNFMFLKVNNHGFFFSRNFSRPPSVRVAHLDFDFDISFNSLWESFLLNSDVIVADGIVDLDLIDEADLIDEVIEATEAILEDVDVEVVGLVAADVDTIFEGADKVVTANFPGVCLNCSLPCTFLGLGSDFLSGILGDLLSGILGDLL